MSTHRPTNRIGFLLLNWESIGVLIDAHYMLQLKLSIMKDSNQKWPKRMKWSLKWQSSYFEKCKFSYYSAKWQQKLQFSIYSWKFIRPNGKCFQKFERYQVCYLSTDKNPKFLVFVTSLDRKKNEKPNFCCPLILANWVENEHYVPRKCGTSKFSEKNKPKTLILNLPKISPAQRSFRRNQRCSALI